MGVVRQAVSAIASFLLVIGLAASNAAAAPTKSPGTPVRVEILPGIQEKWIDPVLAERVPAVVFGAATLDVREIDPATLVLAGAAATKGDDGAIASYRDVDGDGFTDLIASFPGARIRLATNAGQASLSARANDGRLLIGAGPVRDVRSARVLRLAAAPTEAASQKVPPVRVSIDILPGDPANGLELGNRGTVEVAILSAPGFDATKVDPASLRLAGSPVTRREGGGLASLEDVNKDSLPDLVVEVPKKLLRLDASATEAVLTGATTNGRALTGSQRIALAATAKMTFDSDDLPEAPLPQSVDFSNDATITVNDFTTATPYPSTISIAGLTGVISKVTVTLKRLTHSYPDDIDVLLVGPTGQSMVLMSDVGGISPVSNVTLTFDDRDVDSIDTIAGVTTGVYRPSDAGAGDAFPAPASAANAASDLAAFQGTSPNGTWRLYVVDDSTSDTGTIAGWAIDFTLASEFCTPGPITINDAAPAAPYPASIAVSGLTGAVSKVTGVFRGLSHTYPLDLDALLIGPTGANVMILSDVGGTHPGVSGVTLVLDDDAALDLSPFSNPASGTYRPKDDSPGDSLPAPAPALPYGTMLSTFHGTNPNGTWNLYLADGVSGDSGSVGRFCIDITTITPVDMTNPGTIAIPAGAPGTTTGPAGPYPSTIDVSGVTGFVNKVTVTLRGLSHTYPRDLDVVLESPLLPVTNVMLMSDVGGIGPGVSGVTYTFDDDAASSMPVLANAPSGTYKPTNDDSEGVDVLPPPAFSAPYGTTLSVFEGAQPNGAWKLFVFDDASGDVGNVLSGWSITIHTNLRNTDLCQIFPIIYIPAGTPGATQGVADPYPIEFENLGYYQNLEQFRLIVKLWQLDHGSPADLDMLLVGPQGQSVVLMSDAGGGAPGVTNVDLFIDDYGLTGLPQLTNPTTGVYRPTDFEPGDVFPAPAPAGPYGTSLAVFRGTDPRGIWKLYVVDDAPGGAGEGGMGLCLDLAPAVESAEVPNLRWLDRTSLAWDAAQNARSYNVYRGAPGQLGALADHTTDSCRVAGTNSQQLGGVAQNPATSSFFWYLVRGENYDGEGSAGFRRLSGGQVLARVEDSSGACP